MVQGLLVVAVVAAAIFIGQTYPMLGALVAMFPTKMFAYALASDPETATEGIRGLFVGSLGSVACAAAMWFTVRYGMPIALGSGLAAWAAIAAIGKFS
jgi:hypothetical protein